MKRALWFLGVLLICVGLHAECTNVDWAELPADKELTKELRKRFKHKLKKTPIIFSAYVTGAEYDLDEMMAKNQADYSFTVSVSKVIKSKKVAKKKIYNFNYPWRSQKPKIATPQPNDEWVFFASQVKGNNVTPTGTSCGGIGFPKQNKILMKELENIL